MKKLFFITAMALIMASCGKEESRDNNELKSLSGTEWVGQVFDFEEDEYFTATLTFISETKVVMSSGGESMDASYTYNGKLKTGIMTDGGGNSSAFEIKGNDLIIEIEDFTITFKRVE